MNRILLNKKFKVFLIIISIIYICEIILAINSFNIKYLTKKIFFKDLILYKNLINFLINDEKYLTLYKNKLVNLYCDKGKIVSVYFDNKGFFNKNDVWENKNDNLIMKSYGELDCSDFKINLNNYDLFLSKKNLNIGNYSTGPAHQYSILREYIDFIDVKNAFWLHLEGSDLSDINNLKNSKIKNYLIDQKYSNKNFEFNDKDKNKEIDKFINENDYFILKREIKNTINLYRVRNKLSSITSRSNKKLNKNIKYNEINELIEILKKTKKLLDNKGIKLFFIYMPRENETTSSYKNKKIKEILFQKLKEEKIKFEDFTLIENT